MAKESVVRHRYSISLPHGDVDPGLVAVSEDVVDNLVVVYKTFHTQMDNDND